MTADEIIAAYAANDLKNADALFEAAGGELFVFRHGYDKLGQVLAAMPEEHWRKNEAVLCALVLYLTKHGKARRAQAHMLDRDVYYKKTARFAIFQLLIAIHLGDPVHDEDIDQWMMLERRLPILEPLTEGLYCNSMLVVLVRAGRLNDARSFGLRAISAFRTAKHAYLEHFIHLHLADLSVMEGQLRRGRRHLATARACLDNWGETYGNEASIAEIIDLALDYEIGKFRHIPDRSTQLRNSLVEGDSWAEIFNQLGRISVMSLYFTAGRTAALRELEVFQAEFAQRHGRPSDTLALLEIEVDRLGNLIGGDHHRLAELDHRNLRGPIGTALLGGIVAALGDVDTEVQVMTGSRMQINKLLWAARGQEARERRRIVEQAFRVAVRDGVAAPFLENRDVLSGLGPGLLKARFARGHVQLARMARETTRAVKECYWMPPRLKEAGINHRQLQVLTALQSGSTNKQIARMMGVSEAAVKYHLSNLYNLTQTKKRGQLLEKVEELLTFS